MTPLVFLLLSCFGRNSDTEESGDASDPCGDIDGPGGDTGDVPNVLGNWTADFGWNLFKEYCGVENLNSGGDFLIDGAMEVKGRVPDTLYVTFDAQPEDRFWGVIGPTGSVTFSGQYTDRNGTWHVAFGGLAYVNAYNDDRLTMDGFGFLGLDSDSDGTIECEVRGEWRARKSGA